MATLERDIGAPSGIQSVKEVDRVTAAPFVRKTVDPPQIITPLGYTETGWMILQTIKPYLEVFDKFWGWTCDI